MGKRRKNGAGRIYTRVRGGETRFYADFRDYADVGGGREALKPDPRGRATTDPVIAEKLSSDRLTELENRRRGRVVTGIAETRTLKEYAAHHLIQKAKAGRQSEAWIARAEYHLNDAITFLGDRPVAGITVSDVSRWADALRARKSGRGGPDKPLSSGSVRHFINSLSNLYRRAQAEGVVPPGYNPVAAMMDKPVGKSGEARWLEVPDAALLLEAARRLHPENEDKAMSPAMLHAIVGTFLLTGGRKSEVLGLTIGDLSFERSRVTFRPNAHRPSLKTKGSARTIPLWPQLREILIPFLATHPRPDGPDALLFPSVRGTGMVTDLRKALDAVAGSVGWKKGEIRTKMFRHTYCAARLQTLDHGAPVSPFTVSKELGHGGTSLVDRVYGHVAGSPHRSETVEYRVEQWKEQLAPRLTLLEVA